MLSIIIPTYNEETYLPILLESIKKQYYKDFEIIVADHNSTDKTIQIAQSYGARLTSGGLPGRGRNKGAEIARGDLLLFLDADVILSDKSFLLDCVSEFFNNNFGAATCKITPLSSKKRDILSHEIYNIVLSAAAKKEPYAPGFCIFARKSVHQQINGFDEKILLAEDSDYVQRAKKISKFGILKSHKIPVSVRRLERDGRWNIFFKYIFCGIYMSVFGSVKTNIFNYTFGHKENDM